MIKTTVQTAENSYRPICIYTQHIPYVCQGKWELYWIEAEVLNLSTCWLTQWRDWCDTICSSGHHFVATHNMHIKYDAKNPKQINPPSSSHWRPHVSDQREARWTPAAGTKAASVACPCLCHLWKNKPVSLPFEPVRQYTGIHLTHSYTWSGGVMSVRTFRFHYLWW